MGQRSNCLPVSNSIDFQLNQRSATRCFCLVVRHSICLGFCLLGWRNWAIGSIVVCQLAAAHRSLAPFFFFFFFFFLDDEKRGKSRRSVGRPTFTFTLLPSAAAKESNAQPPRIAQPTSDTCPHTHTHTKCCRRWHQLRASASFRCLVDSLLCVRTTCFPLDTSNRTSVDHQSTSPSPSNLQWPVRNQCSPPKPTTVLISLLLPPMTPMTNYGQ